MGVGDKERFERIYQRYQPQILSYCLRRSAPHDATDLTAEVFATAWRRRRDVPTGEEIRPWLYGVARNVLNNHRRGMRRRSNLFAKAQGYRDPPQSTPEDALESREDHMRLREAVSRLKSVDREILLLAAWEGLSHAEMSSALRISAAAVDKRLVRAKMRLAQQYELLSGVPGLDSVTGDGGAS